MIKKINLPVIDNRYNATHEGIVSKNTLSIPRHYYLDSSLNHKEWQDEFDSSKYTSVHILGNSPCLSKVPLSMLKDEKAFVIGLNRSYLQFESDVLLFKDQATLEDISNVVNNDKEPYASRIRNSRLIKCSSGLPVKKSVMRKHKGKVFESIEYKESNLDISYHRKFIDALQRQLRNDSYYVSYKLNSSKEYPFNPSVLDGDSSPLLMMISVANGAMHLVSKLFNPNKVKVYLHGISYNNRTYFYGDDMTQNKSIREQYGDLTNNDTRYQDTRCTDGLFTFSSNLRNNVPDKQEPVEHREACFYFVYYLTLLGFNIRYTAESEILDYCASEFESVNKYEV